MILVAAIIAGIVGSLVVVIVQLCKSPVGYEDADGFHIVELLKCSAVIRRRKSNRAGAPSLKGAEAHS